MFYWWFFDSIKAMEFEDRYKKLNKNQKFAVDTIEGPLLVIAGPGSGKTEILSLRVCKILKETDTRPSSILCLTFTEAAAFNMRDRLSKLIGKDAYKISIYTFHSFCTDIISTYPEYFFNSAKFNPADEATKREIINKIFEELKFDDPLRSFHEEQGFVFLEDSLSSISDIKRAGITPLDFLKIIEDNKKILDSLSPVISKNIPIRVSKKDTSGFSIILDSIEKLLDSNEDSIASVLHQSLKTALDQSVETDSSKPLSKWKEKFISKLKDSFVLKDFLNLEKMYSLASIYKKYSEEIHRKGFFDFDDMIIEVLKKLENDSNFLSIISEKYEYVLVDEFQDTNDAQIRLLFALTSHFIHEGRPNVMAVGDDDQSIFKFQGAEISNMTSFIKKYREPKIISLNENYRSNKYILDVSESVITQSSFSLRKILPDIEKKIVSARKPEIGKVYFKLLPDSLSEYYFIAEEIIYLNKKGIEFKDIAIISRRHKTLKELISYLHYFKIPVSYQKKKNVLDDEIISQIIIIMRFIDSVISSKSVRDDLLPQILSFPFWNIKHESIWKISLSANKNKNSWLETMKSSEDESVRYVADFLIDLSVKANFMPAERVIDNIIGGKLSNYEEDDLKDDNSLNGKMKEYYFSSKTLENDKGKYLSFLSSLRVFIESIREYKKTDNPKVSDIISFIDLYVKNGLEILDESIYSESENAVSLLTAHSSKGLEFKAVFVASSDNDTWVSSGFKNKISLPSNLKLRPSADDLDDKIRLFYVALTRAKDILYITSHKVDEKGKSLLVPEFLNHHLDSFEDISNKDYKNSLEASKYDSYIISKDDKSLLEPILKDYKMSVTHLNNFLNIINSGPKMFLEHNLLRFPQPKTLSSIYGTAVHESILFAYTFLKREGKLPVIEDILQKAFLEIDIGRLSDNDNKFLKDKIEKTLTSYFKEKGNEFIETDLIETNFNNQGVSIEKALITGKIDKMVINDGEIVVTDFKTGKPISSFEDNDAKVLGYKRQLIFYKLLVENSSSFDKYKVNQGVIQSMDLESHFPEIILYIKEDDVLRLKNLIEKVYKKIKNLDFPDISKYPQTVSGIKQFEDDLLKDSI